MQTLSELVTNPFPEKQHWIGGGVLPKDGVMLLGGESKIGKTLLILNILKDLSDARHDLWNIPGFTIEEPVPTLLIDQETGSYEIRKRAEKLWGGETPAPNIFYIDKEPISIDTNRGCDALSRLIEECDAKVVALDPVSRCIEGGESSNDDIERLARRLMEIRRRFNGLSFILSHHFGKPPKYDPNNDYDPLDPNNFRGASKWVNFPDTIVTIIKTGGKEGLWNLKTGWMFRQGAPRESVDLVVRENYLIEHLPSRKALRDF